jgi:hypothetical protein
MSAREKTEMLKAAPDLYYAVEKGFTLVVKESSGEAFRLTGLEQIVWDCLNLGYARDRVEATLAEAGRLSPEAARSVLEAVLQEWKILGLVQTEAPEGG